MTVVLDRVYPDGIISDIVSQHLRISEDAEVLYDNACMCVRNAFDVAEAYTNRIIVDTLATFKFESVDTRIELPTAPVKEVVEVRYRHVDGDWRTLDASTYQLVSSAHNAYLLIHDELAVTSMQGPCMEISVRCGYDEDGDYPLPGSIRQAVMLMAGTFNSFEGDAQVGSVAELPMSARYLLSHYRLFPYGG